MDRTISEINFSLKSIITDSTLREDFYRWVCGVSPKEPFNKIDFLNSPISESDIPESLKWKDIVNYGESIKYENNRVTDLEVEELRILRIDTAEWLFTKFLHEGLSPEKIQAIESRWNYIFNSFIPVDYDNFELDLKGYSGILNDKPFILHEQQKKGIAFLCSKGNGLLAYDVGVGKTATGIAAAVYQLQHGICSRPLIIVPKAVYPKWIHDTKELFPELKINLLENLNLQIIDELRMNSVFSAENDGYLLPENSLTLCTTEALEKIYFDKDTVFSVLYPSFEHILTKKKINEYFEIPQDLPESDYVLFEELGIDLLVVDEAHRYKNLIRKTSKHSYTEFGNFGFGEPSARAIKMFALTEYIHRNNDEKNVFFLSATPFTNSPMEIYSMLRFLGGNEIVYFGYESINEFLNEFAEIKIEWSVNNKNEVVRKTVMKSFRSLFALQQLIQNYIDKVSAEDANIKRPEKVTYVEKVQMTELQNKIYNAEINRITFAKNLGDIFKGMNNMRMCMISPVLIKQQYNDFEIPDLSELVSTSPKLTLVCKTVLNVYQKKPDCGQIIYLPRGIKESSILKNYLIDQGIPQKAIALVNSSTTEKQKEKITDDFNNPEKELKILIGSETISEGVDLNGNSLVLYNCLLGWNPTEPIQVEGRLWRQGNRQKKVHIVYPLMYDSIDSLIYQKHDEKATRIDAIWNYRGDKINVEEINPGELKFDLIKDPAKKADMKLEKEAIPYLRELKIIKDSKNLIIDAEKRIFEINKQIAHIDDKIEQIKKEEKIINNQNIPEELKRLSFIVENETQNKIKAQLSMQKSLNKQLALLQEKLKLKLEAVLGENNTDEGKFDYLNKLDIRKAHIEEELEKLEEKRFEYLNFFTEENKHKEEIENISLDEIITSLSKQILS